MTHHRVKSSNLYSIAFEHDPADKLLGDQFRLLIALLRLGLRRGPEQLKLLMERK